MTQETNDYLAHHGILGQKWGVRRYQNYDGSLTALGRKHRGLSEKSSASSASSDLKKAVKTIQKTRKKYKAEHAKDREVSRKKAAEDKAAKEARDHEKLKQHIRRHPKDIYKHRDELTREEAKELIDQIEWDRKMADIKFDEFKRFNARTKEVGTALTNITNIFDKGLLMYNDAALVYNTLIDHQLNAGSMTAEEAKKARLSKVDWGDKKEQK